jgi:hypothetical protein
MPETLLTVFALKYFTQALESFVFNALWHIFLYKKIENSYIKIKTSVTIFQFESIVYRSLYKIILISFLNCLFIVIGFLTLNLIYS